MVARDPPPRWLRRPDHSLRRQQVPRHVDENGFEAEPTKTTATPDEVIWEFDTPDGDTLGISLDARIEPGVAKYKTWIMP